MIPERRKTPPINYYLHLILALVLVAGGYSLYLRMGYLIGAGLVRGPGLTDLMGNPVGNDFVGFYAAAVVVWAWCRQLPLWMRGSVLTICIFFATNYALEYDLALLGLPFAWLGWEEYTHGRTRGEAFLMACWAGLFFAGIAAGHVGFQASPLILLGMLWLALRRAPRPEPDHLACGS